MNFIGLSYVINSDMLQIILSHMENVTGCPSRKNPSVVDSLDVISPVTGNPNVNTKP